MNEKKTLKVKKSFQQLGLKKDVIEAINKLGYSKPTLVQEKIIPLVLEKHDLAFTAQTGSGKTLAYTLGVLSRIQPKQHIQLLIITPTRELCMQIGAELKKLGAILGFNVGSFYGGHDLNMDKRLITKKLHVVVATPGRLIQHINFKTLKVGDVKTIVFDESDQMFDNGFYDDCVYIINRVSVSAQVLLSSATINPQVEEFIGKYIPDHKQISIGVQIPKSISQEAFFCKIEEKNEELLTFLNKERPRSVLIFANTKTKLQSINDFLKSNDYKITMLSSDLEQKDREKVLEKFKERKYQILVCTDVASRGLQIDDVDLVINYDIPKRKEFYVHRIGRTGRTQKKGKSLSLVCPEDEEAFMAIQDEYAIDITILNSLK
jgi:ATP-dependent RNA helicase DeaD